MTVHHFIWIKLSEGVVLECRATKFRSDKQYPFWSVSTYPSIKALEDSFGSSLHAIYELDFEGVDWEEMGR